MLVIGLRLPNMEPTELEPLRLLSRVRTHIVAPEDVHLLWAPLIGA
jgi:hypothetical protein